MLMESCSEKSVETHCVAPWGYCGCATPVPEKGGAAREVREVRGIHGRLTGRCRALARGRAGGDNEGRHRAGLVRYGPRHMTGQAGTAHAVGGAIEPAVAAQVATVRGRVGPRARAAPERLVLKLQPPQQAKKARPLPRPPRKAAGLGRRVSAGDEGLVRRPGVRLMGSPSASLTSRSAPVRYAQ
jgi:hypothetical protein